MLAMHNMPAAATAHAVDLRICLLPGGARLASPAILRDFALFRLQPSGDIVTQGRRGVKKMVYVVLLLR
jgi:hypothetical protein